MSSSEEDASEPELSEQEDRGSGAGSPVPETVDVDGDEDAAPLSEDEEEHVENGPQGDAADAAKKPKPQKRKNVIPKCIFSVLLTQARSFRPPRACSWFRSVPRRS